MRYGKTLDACALGPDLDILPGRDMVEIGEKVQCTCVQEDVLSSGSISVDRQSFDCASVG